MPFGSTERERRHDAKISEAEPEFVRRLRENGPPAEWKWEEYGRK